MPGGCPRYPGCARRQNHHTYAAVVRWAATMTDAEELFEELQAELQESGETLGELLQRTIDDPSSAPDVVVDLLEEAADTGQSVGELLQDAIQDSDELMGDLSDGNLFVDTGDDAFRMNFDDDLLFVDPSESGFEDVLRSLDVFGIGEQLGFVPRDDK